MVIEQYFLFKLSISSCIHIVKAAVYFHNQMTIFYMVFDEHFRWDGHLVSHFLICGFPLNFLILKQSVNEYEKHHKQHLSSRGLYFYSSSDSLSDFTRLNQWAKS